MADEQDFSAEERELIAAGSKSSKTCPECAETVQGAARVCRFCGYRFDGKTEGTAEDSSTDPGPGPSAARRSPRRRTAVLIALGVVILLAGAGVVLAVTQQGASEDAPPARVTAADLAKDGRFWISLTPDLKDDLVDFAKSRLAEQRGPEVQLMDNGELVAGIDREFTNPAKQAQDIYGIYVGANNALAQEDLDGALTELDALEEDALAEEELQGDVQADLENFIREDIDENNAEDGFPERVSEVGCVPETNTTFRCLVDFDDGTQLSGQGTYDPDTGDLLYELEP